MCKVCDLTNKGLEIQAELNFRVQVFKGELAFSKAAAAELRVRCVALFAALMDNMELTESTKEQFELMDDVAISQLKH